MTSKRGGDGGNEPTHKVDTIHLWVIPHVLGDRTIVHPSTNDLERRYLGGNSDEGDNVGMPQALPHDNFSVKDLLVQKFKQRLSEGEGGIDLFRDTPSVLNVRSQSLDTDLFPIEFRLVHVGKTSGRNCFPFRKRPARNDVGLWQDPTVAADTLEPP